MDRGVYEELARLLTYPEEDGGCGVEEFAAGIAGLSLYQRQELFIQTFDLNPVCSLEMGWHLFGENYDRGLLLVKMRQLLRAHGIAEGAELPDHLPNGLRLLARMEHGEAAYFAEAIPFHLTTKEFYTLVRAHLAPGGVVISNLLGQLRGPRSSLFRAMYRTHGTVFPGLYPFAVAYQPDADAAMIRNIMLVATAERDVSRGEILTRARRCTPAWCPRRSCAPTA